MKFENIYIISYIFNNLINWYFLHIMGYWLNLGAKSLNHNKHLCGTSEHDQL